MGQFPTDRTNNLQYGSIPHKTKIDRLVQVIKRLGENSHAKPGKLREIPNCRGSKSRDLVLASSCHGAAAREWHSNHPEVASQQTESVITNERADLDQGRLESMASIHSDPVVITGIGLVTANGFGRESVWESVRDGICGIRPVEAYHETLPECLNLAAAVDITPEYPGQLKSIQLSRLAAAEAVFDSGVDMHHVDRSRFGCAISGHIGDLRFWRDSLSPPSGPAGAAARFESEQWLPNSACWNIANRYGLLGPRFSHSTACASGLIDILTAARAIRDGQCDIAIAGSGEGIDPLFAAGFAKMRVLAGGNDPTAGCLPFDRRRHGFVMGEGAGVFVIERLSHALGRNAKIYAELAVGRVMSDAHHVTSLNVESEALERLIRDTLQAAEIGPEDVGYINAHGTGTAQNDLLETRGIRRAFGSAADQTCVSSAKSMIGHLVNASGSVELGLTVLGMRDGYAPPTLHLDDPDPECDLDYVPLMARASRYQHALKLSLAFGGHLVAAVVRRWNDAASGFSYPEENLTPARRAA